MKKKMLCLLGGIALALGFAVTSFDVPVCAFAGYAEEGLLFDGTDYVADPYGFMDTDEEAELEAMAASLSETYQCGMYLAIVGDIFEYVDYETFDAYEAATMLYREYDLGAGDGKDGTLLILSMSERDYALIAYGDFANAAFTDYGKDVLSEEFLDDFAYDDWYDGFEDYLEKSGQMLEMAAAGNYFDVDTDSDMAEARIVLAVIVLIVAAVIAGIVCAIAVGSMKSVGKKRNATTYMLTNSLRLGRRVDLYTHSTESRQPINNSSNTRSGSRGGTTIRSGGFSGKSGKF